MFFAFEIVIHLLFGFSFPVFSNPKAISGPQAESLGIKTWFDALTSSFGAGIFEEFIFRVLVIEGVLFLLS